MKYSITNRLFKSVILLLVPLLVLQGGVYFWSRNCIQKEIEGNAYSNVQYLRQSFEERIFNIYESSSILLEGASRFTGRLQPLPIESFYTKLSHNSFTGPAEYYQLFADIRDSLNILKYSNDVIKNITLLFPEYDTFICTDSSVAYSLQKIDKLYAASHAQTPSLMLISGKLFAVFCKPAGYNIENARILLCVELQPDAFRTILSSYSENKNSYLYSSTSDFLLCNDANGDLSAANLSAVLENDRSTEIRQFDLDINGKRRSIFFCYSDYLGMYILQAIPSNDLFRIPNMIGLLLIILCFITLFVLLLLLRLLKKTVSEPVQVLKTAFVNVSNGDFNMQLPQQNAEEFNQLATGYNSMVKHIESLIDTNYRQTIRLQTAELKQLQAQINPHFLYNSYYFLRHLVSIEENETAEEMCRYLGQYFQYITRNERSTISLADEYSHALTYLNIQLMRFGETVHAEIPATPSCFDAIQVPRLIIEPVVENCFKHGMNALDNVGIIRISIDENESGIMISIENNGGDLSDEKLNELSQNLSMPSNDIYFTGLINTHQRLKLFFGPEGRIGVSRSDLGGLKVMLSIPKNRNEGSEHP